MWNYALFRIGAAIAALHAVLHLFDHFGSKSVKPVNGTEFQLQELLYGYKANIMGAMRSRGEIDDGLNLAFVTMLLLLSALGFTLKVERKPALIIAIAMAVLLAISITHWYILPTAFLAAALACFGASAYGSK